MSRRRDLVRRSALGLLLAFVALLLLEGLASFAYVATRSARIAVHRLPSHTQHDTDLGWSGRPGFELADMFGPERGLRLNATGLRNDRSVGRERTNSRQRIICSGDSFTFGYGVADGDTWCRQLEALLPAVETVNLAEAGYGADQMFLRYRRDGATLERDVHLFAPVMLDFARMSASRYQGRAKPWLRLDNTGGLVVAGVPVPREGKLGLWFRDRVGGQVGLLRDTGLYRFSEAVLRRSGVARQAPSHDAESAGSGPEQLVPTLLDELARLDGPDGVRLIVVLLPLTEDLASPASDTWRIRLEKETSRLGIEFLDLVTPLRELPTPETAGFFLTSEAGFDPAAGHYTAAGNRWVAERLARALLRPRTEAP